MSIRRQLLRADSLADPVLGEIGRAAVLIETDETVVDNLSFERVRVLAAGERTDVDQHPLAENAEYINLPGRTLLPALVNAHTHLDLTSVGPRPYEPEEGFASWISMVRESRPRDPGAIQDAVLRACGLSRAGGVAMVGDIAGDWTGEPGDALRRSGMWGVSFLEVFGLGEREAASIDRLTEMVGGFCRRHERVKPGIQPHAPYSAGPGLFAAAADLAAAKGLPIATHLAETRAESELLASGKGPLAEMLASFGLWNDSCAESLVSGRSPVDHLSAAFAKAPFCCAHVNTCGSNDRRALAGAGASVVYCPRAHEYFGHEHDLGPHPYRELMRDGVNVALGTDSIINVPPDQADRLSTFDEMRLLFRRDRQDPTDLLRMATVNGACALRFDESCVTLAGDPHEVAGVAVLDAPSLREGLERDLVPRLLAGARPSERKQ